jgi:hypothetical protein
MRRCFGRNSTGTRTGAQHHRGGDWRYRGGTRAAPFLVILGPSGCGKSSFMRAGLVPALRSGGVPSFH